MSSSPGCPAAPPNYPEPRASTLPSFPLTPASSSALGATAGLGRVGGSICLPCHASWGLCPQPGTPAPTEPPPNPRPTANSAASLLCSNPSSARARAHPRLAGGEAAEAGGTRGEAEAVLRHLQNPHLLVLRSSPRRLRPAGGLLPVRPRARGAAAGAPHQEEASSLSGRAGGLRPGRGRGRGPRLPPGSLGPTTPSAPTLAAPALRLYSGQSRGLRCRKDLSRPFSTRAPPPRGAWGATSSCSRSSPHRRC